MIKDVFKFKKNAWHVKLMKFVWGYNFNDFPNMCPYFWLSVVNVVFFPVILPIKLFVLILVVLTKMCESTVDSINKACDSKVMKWVAEKTERLWDDDDLTTLVIKYGRMDSLDWFYLDKKKRYEKYRIIYEKLSDEDRDKLWAKYNARLDAMREESDKAWRESVERQAKATTVKMSRSAKIGRATVVIKKVFNIVVWPILAFLLYLLYLLIAAATTWDYSWMPRFGYALYLIVGTGLGIFFFIWPITVFVAWINCKLKGVCIPCEARRKQIGKFFRYFLFLKYPFVWIWMFFKGIWNGLVLIKDIIVAFKKDNCPSIDWED